MIRGRKEGSTYATWFIGFDHDDTFGLPAFPELPPQSPRSPVHSKPVSRAASLETLVSVDHQSKDPPQPVHPTLTPVSTQTSSNQTSKQSYTQTTEDNATQTPHQVSTQTTTHISTEVSTETLDLIAVPRSETPTYSETRSRSPDIEDHRSRRRKERDTRGLYKEAFDGAKRAEEFKFRVKFDKLIGDLHLAIEEKNENGLTSFGSPSYGDVMLTFKEKVKELLKGFTQRLQLAYESFGSEDSPENNGQKVKQNVSRFIEELIGETLDLTSDEAVSDLSSLSDDSTSDQNSFEDLIAQAVVSKLLENQRKEVNEALRSSYNHKPKKNNLKDQGTETPEILRLQRDSYDYNDKNQNADRDSIDGQQSLYSINLSEKSTRVHNGSSFSNPDLFSYKSSLIPDDTEEEIDKENYKLDSQSGLNNKVNGESDIIDRENDKSSSSHLMNKTNEPNGISGVEIQNGVSDDEIDIVKEFEQLKEFVKQTRSSARQKVEAVVFDDSVLCEVQEATFHQTTVDRDEEREEFHTRYSVFDRIHNWEPALPDFSEFENIDFASDEIDPDLLSMNLAIIPEETEEELEQEEEEDEQNRWTANWLFKGKGVSPYENMGKKTVNLNSEGSLYMMVPRPDGNYPPRIGHRDIDQLSDFSEHDLLGRTDLDGSDDEENTFYAHTSKELARISAQRKRSSNSQRFPSGNRSDDSDFESSAARKKAQQLYNKVSLDDVDDIHIPGPIVEPSKQELKLLQDLVPAENDDPKFLVAPESVTVQEGEPVRFSCRVAGTAAIDVFWYREGDEVEELEESEDVEITSGGDKHSIVLYNTSKKMAGQYMCIALNETGKAVQYLVVTVKDNKQELKKPEFLKGLKDVEVTEGQSVKFRVKVKGYPPPRISWLKDGELLKSTKTCRIEKFGNRDYILTIDYASMNDDAEYTVSARNVAGEERMSAQVIVEPQSDMPVRRQKISSNTTSGASDSDSDRSTPRRTLLSAPSSTASKGLVQDRESHLLLNQLDRKVTLTQIKLGEEVQKNQEIAKKDEIPEKRRLITEDTLDVLKAANEIIQLEQGAADLSTISAVNGDGHSPSFEDTIDDGKVTSANSSPRDLNSGSLIEDLALPDTLDEFPLPNLGSKTLAPVVSTFDLTLPGRNHANNLPGRETSASANFKSEVKFSEQTRKNSSLQSISSQRDSLHNQKETNLNSVSVNNGKEPSVKVDTASAPSSVSSDTNSKDLEETDLATIASRQRMLREQYSRDFEVPQTTEKKRWSVTLDSFSPQAEVVNKQSSTKRTNEGASSIEINVTDLSPPSSIRSLKGDNSSQSSSRRQSTDSGVSVSTKQKRPAPVHMVGHTTEEEVPESRTEFNTDGSIELPSVNRLKAMFSNMQDEDLGNGTFKRIHSITARNVPKEQLEKLRAYNQNESSSSSGQFLEVPGSSSTTSSSTTLQLNSSNTSSSLALPSSSKVTSTSLIAEVVPLQEQKTLQASAIGPYRGLDPDKDPVLIYPETDPDYMHRHQPQALPVEAKTLAKSNRAHLMSQPNQQQQQINKTPATAAKKLTVSLSNTAKPQQTKLLVRRAVTNDENENVKKSGPRIRSGCISARAAFWERKIVEGAVGDDVEFPDMVEDDDI